LEDFRIRRVKKAFDAEEDFRKRVKQVAIAGAIEVLQI